MPNLPNSLQRLDRASQRFMPIGKRMLPLKQRLKVVSLAFSGSGVLLPAHAGLAARLIEAGYSFASISGTSGGGIIAACVACGFNGPQLHDLVINTDYTKFLTLSPLSLIRAKGYCNGNYLLGFLTDALKGKRFGDITTPCSIIATDIGDRTPFVFSQQTTPDVHFATACRASASVPFIFEPVIFEGKTLMDGGLVNNIPISYLKKGTKMLGADVEEKSGGSPKGIFQLGAALISILLSANQNTQKLVAEKAGAQLIELNVGQAWFLDTKMSQEEKERLFQIGYTAGTKWLATQ